MENINYGISPEEEMSTIMKDIEKNIQNQKLDVESSNQEETDNASIIETSDTEEDTKDLRDEAGSAEEEEHINEADLFKEKYHLEKKKRKSALADRQKLEQENYQLKNALDGTINNNAELYKRDLYNDLEKIRNIKKQALLGDDPDLLIEADEIYQKTLLKINEFENIVSDRAAPAVNNQGTENYNEQVKLTKAQEWVGEHPELVEGSHKYNPKIQKELGNFIEQFDRELQRNGREDEILSDAYLDVLEEFIDSVKVNRPQDGYTTSKVGGVRNNFSNGTSNTIKVTLTEFDKNYAKNLGISEKEYLKYKIEDIKESRMRSR